MGEKAGFHSGEIIGNRLKVDGKYVNEREFIAYEDFDTTYVSGTAASVYVIAGSGAQAVPSYMFGIAANNQVSFRLVAPDSLKRNAKIQMRVYWTLASGSTAGEAVWGAEYWVTGVLTSGVELAGKNYNVSGALLPTGGAAVTSEYGQKTSLVSGVITEATLDVAAGDVAAGDVVRVQLFRHGESGSDTLISSAYLLGVLVEYVDR